MVSTQSRREAVLAAAAEPGWRWLRKAAADPSLRIAGSLWLASKIAIFALAWVAAWIMSPGSRHPLRLTSVWEHWDATEFRGIAEYGYFGGPDKSNPNQAAFFPGYPLLLRGVHVLVPAWTADELIIGTVASFFAILGLVQLAEDYRAGVGCVGRRIPADCACRGVPGCRLLRGAVPRLCAARLAGSPAELLDLGQPARGRCLRVAGKWAVPGRRHDRHDPAGEERC